MKRSRVIMLLTIGIAFTMIASGLSLYPSEKTSNNFSPAINYVYTFSESGLFSDITQWSVTLTGTGTKTAAPGNDIVWTLTSGGSRAYTVGSVPGYSSSPSSGSTLYGVTVAIAFSGSPEVPSLSGLTASPNPTDVGIGSTFSGQGASFNDVNGGAYNWKLPGESSYVQTSSDSAGWAPTSAGSGTAYLYLSSGAGNSATAQETVTVNALPTVTASASKTTADTGQAIDFTATPSSGTSPYTYTWYDKISGGSYETFSTAQDPSYAFTSAGTYSVYVRVTDSVTGTGISSTLTLTINQGVTVGIISSSANPSLVNDSVTFSVSASGGTSPYTYQWYQDGSTVGTNSSSYTVTFTTAKSYSIYVTVTDTASDSATSNTLTQVVDATYVITFSETGLSSQTWYINITGQTPLSTTSSSQTIHLPNGTYYYTAACAISYYGASPSSGSFTVAGSGSTISTTFTEYTYVVTFNETGLPSGTSWSVDVISESNISTVLTSQSMTLLNGTYSFRPYSAGQYLFAPANGSFTINGGPAFQPIVFIPYYVISFVTSGLSSGNQYTLTSLGSNFTGTAGTDLNISTTQASLDYSYVSLNPEWFEATGTGGSISFNSNYNVTLGFKQIRYAVSFVESGYSGTWEVAVTPSGTNLPVYETSSTNTILINVSADTYDYTAWVPGDANYSLVAVSGIGVYSNATVDITFKLSSSNPVLTAFSNYDTVMAIFFAILILSVIGALVYLRRG